MIGSTAPMPTVSPRAASRTSSAIAAPRRRSGAESTVATSWPGVSLSGGMALQDQPRDQRVRGRGEVVAVRAGQVGLEALRGARDRTVHVDQDGLGRGNATF